MWCLRSSGLHFPHSLTPSLKRVSVAVRNKHTPAIGRKKREAAKKVKGASERVSDGESGEGSGINWYPGHIAKVSE
jgi:hypothetical protein